MLWTLRYRSAMYYYYYDTSCMYILMDTSGVHVRMVTELNSEQGFKGINLVYCLILLLSLL